MSERLDLVVARKFGLTRAKAAAAIMAGRVTVDDQPARKAGQSISDSMTVEYRGDTPPVSRAAGKLAGALDEWNIPLDGRTVLDIGASTGGFTEVALQHGARKVYAVDVGHGQLDWKLRRHGRVVNFERTDIRTLESSDLPEPPDLAVADVSFISLRQVLPAAARLLPPGATVIALFKPQFEVGRTEASKHRGVIRDEAVVERVFTEFTDWITARGWTVRGQVESSVAGTKGNRERLVWLETPRSPATR